MRRKSPLNTARTALCEISRSRCKQRGDYLPNNSVGGFLFLKNIFCRHTIRAPNKFPLNSLWNVVQEQTDPRGSVWSRYQA